MKNIKDALAAEKEQKVKLEKVCQECCYHVVLLIPTLPHHKEFWLTFYNFDILMSTALLKIFLELTFQRRLH